MGSTTKTVVDLIEASSGAHFSGFHLDGLDPRNSEVEQPTTSAAEHEPTQPFVIGVAGGAASGKTPVCDMIIEQLHDQRVVLVNQDSFYHHLTAEELTRVHEYNFDHPDAFDTEQLLCAMEKLKHGQAVDIPKYDFKSYKNNIFPARRVNPSDVIILEGILIFHDPRVRDLMNMKIFVDTDADVRLARRIRRDTVEKSRDINTVLDQYSKFVKPAFDDFILPTKKYADVIIPRGGDNQDAGNLTVSCNSSVLHYGHAAAPNEREDGDMALLDMGAEYHFYGSDITCSFPVNGKFTSDQCLVHNAVLAAHNAVIASIRPGVSWVDMHKLAEKIILESLKKGCLLVGDVDDMMAERLGAAFMPHGLGHFLGIDTHDPGGYLKGATRPLESGLRSLRTSRELQKGMVITVEPGCYFIDALLTPAMENSNTSKFFSCQEIARFKGSGGVRIESNVHVTANGCLNMTKVPRETWEIEAVMAGESWPLENGFVGSENG